MTDGRNKRAWRVVGVSAAGAGHEKNGEECQDFHRWGEFSGVLVAAIADGAGTAQLGEIGAKIAADAGFDALCSRIDVLPANEDLPAWRELFRQSLESARSALESEAAARIASVREFGTTLILLVATQEIVAAAQIGDGAVAFRDDSGKLTCLTIPPAEGYVNETLFLTSPGAIDSAQLKMWTEPVSHIAAFTDGLQMLALQMPQGIPHEPFFTPLFQFASNANNAGAARAELETFLRSPRVTERTNDDVTLLIASRVG